ncbi:general stress protein [Aminobacter sp. UC22_36]|uniref:general stress protein n=1 Tax=Aminobacter sp. UC22_36 TaxID=3374549 RepID=UPI0037579AA2
MVSVTGLFDNYSDAQAAVEELQQAGISHDDVSVVASNADGSYDADSSETAEAAGTGAGIGALVGGTGGLLTGLGVMAIPGVGPVVAAGWLAATAAGAAAGALAGGATGGLIGALTDSGIPSDDAHVYAEGVRRGGTLVTARVTEGAEEDTARSILHNANRVDIGQRRAAYADDGWTAFDETADPFSPQEIDEERRRYASRIPPVV